MSKLRESSESKHGRKGRWGLSIIVLLAVVPLLVIGSSMAYGAHLENNDSFCASCHTEPETTYVQQAHDAVNNIASAQDLAAVHAAQKQAVKCIDCHSGAGVSGRIDAMKLGARDLAAYVRGNYPQPSPLTHAIADVNCVKCHANYADDRSFENHFHYLLFRWRQFAGDQAATCVDCHSSHTSDGEAKVAFLNQQRTVNQCNACHRTIGD